MWLAAGTAVWRNKPGPLAREQIAKWRESAELAAMRPLWRHPKSEQTGQTLNSLKNG